MEDFCEKYNELKNRAILLHKELSEIDSNFRDLSKHYKDELLFSIHGNEDNYKFNLSWEGTDTYGDDIFIDFDESLILLFDEEKKENYIDSIKEMVRIRNEKRIKLEKERVEKEKREKEKREYDYYIKLKNKFEKDEN